MRRLAVVAAMTALSVMVGCGGNDGGDPAPVFLRITKVQGSDARTASAAWADTLLSDVRTWDTVYNDLVKVSLDVLQKDPRWTDPNTRSMNDVILKRYIVRYVRSDNHNTPGADVPYQISGSLSGMVPLESDTPTDVVFTVVRHTAKEEAPLLGFVNGGGERLLTTIAEITVYGETSSGMNVQAVGYLEITFADFADPPRTGGTPTPTA